MLVVCHAVLVGVVLLWNPNGFSNSGSGYIPFGVPLDGMPTGTYDGVGGAYVQRELSNTLLANASSYLINTNRDTNEICRVELVGNSVVKVTELLGHTGTVVSLFSKIYAWGQGLVGSEMAGGWAEQSTNLGWYVFGVSSNGGGSNGSVWGVYGGTEVVGRVVGMLSNVLGEAGGPGAATGFSGFFNDRLVVPGNAGPVSLSGEMERGMSLASTLLNDWWRYACQAMVVVTLLWAGYVEGMKCASGDLRFQMNVTSVVGSSVPAAGAAIFWVCAGVSGAVVVSYSVGACAQFLVYANSDLVYAWIAHFFAAHASDPTASGAYQGVLGLVTVKGVSVWAWLFRVASLVLDFVYFLLCAWYAVCGVLSMRVLRWCLLRGAWLAGSTIT